MSALRTATLLLLASLLSVGCGAAGEEQFGGGPIPEGDLGTADEELSGVSKRFEFATLNCSNNEVACPADAEKCFCSDHFDQLNQPAGTAGNPTGKYLVVGSDRARKEIRAVGNFGAYTVNKMNRCSNSTKEAEKNDIDVCSGAERAKQIMDDANELWGHPENAWGNNAPKPPQWFFLNELVSTWNDDSAAGDHYREWIINLARALNNTHHRKVVIFAWANPQANLYTSAFWKKLEWFWTEVGKVAYVGMEHYVSGAELKAKQFSQQWCEDQYAAHKRHFVVAGVPAHKVFLAEHFAQTKRTCEVGENETATPCPWGRAGVSDDEWRKTIRVRAHAAQAVGFAGFVSYGWAGNAMGEAEASRLAYEKLYGSLQLP